MVKQVKRFFFIFTLYFTISGVYAQYLEINPIYNITKSLGDELHPDWSSDGKSLVFQSNKNGNWDIYKYNLENDSLIQLTHSNAQEEYPVLLNSKQHLVYTSDISGESKLYISDLATGTEKLLFDREIKSKAATFPESDYLLYFLGFNELPKQWGLYRYEIKYNSLKFMLPLSTEKYPPKISTNSELILISSYNAEKSVEELNIYNWYGKLEENFQDFNIIDPEWFPGGLKIIFVSDKDDKAGEIYTIWKDGSHLERLTNDSLKIKNPVVSPTLKYMAVSVLVDGGFDLFVIPLEDY